MSVKTEYKNLINIDNLKKLNLPKIDADIWTFEKLIEDFYLSYSDINHDLFDISKFDVFQIYDNPHQSDESSYLYLIYFNNKLSCIIGKSGDRGGFYSKFVSKEAGIELYNYFVSLIGCNIEFDILEKEEILDDNHTILLHKDEELYYNLTSPSWGYIDIKKPLFRLEDDESLTSITFLRFKTTKKSWEEKSDDEFIIASLNGQEIEVPYYRLLTKQSL